MDSTHSIFSLDGAVAPDSRAPLATIMPNSTNLPSKQIRRKNSFLVRVDSSEDPPSPHASIYEAIYTSASNSDEVGVGVELVAFDNNGPPGTRVEEVNDENSRQDPADTSAIENGEFLYGRGTVLDTITEQKSYGTFQTQTETKSLDNMPNFPFVRHRDSFALSQIPRRKQAFSLDDIDLIQSSYHEVCAMIEREAHKPLSVHEIYTEPLTPLHAPLERPLTPEGMPSWTSSQNIVPNTRHTSQIQQPHTPGRFRKLFGLPSRKADPAAVSPNTRSVSEPIRGRQAPRFRPPRSVYGRIEQHPFMNAPIARVIQPSVSTRNSTLKGKNKTPRKTSQQVRFTPSATARDSEITALRTAIESTSGLAPHPIMPLDRPVSPVITVKCHHRKGRAALAKATHNLNHGATNPPSNEYVLNPPSTRPDSGMILPTVICSPSPTPDHSMATPWPSRATSPSRPISRISSVRSEEFVLMGSSSIPPLSISSTAHLMSGAIISYPSPQSSTNRLPQPEDTTLPRTKPAPKPKELWCWKCKVNTAAKKVDHWAMQSVGCICFVCCGYDFKDDISCGVAYSPADGRRLDGGGASLRGGGGSVRSDMRGPRIVSL